MRSEDLFNDIDDKTADRLSKEYPVLKDEQKERLYAMSKRKFDINNENENTGIDVSGVEKYRRPKWYKGASIAAAAVLLVAGIGGSVAFISRNGKTPLAEVTTEAVKETTTDAEDTVNVAEEVDADVIAKELTDDWLACLYDVHGRTLEVDKSAVVTKTITSYGGDEITRDFYRVTDKRYPTWEDLEKRCYEVCDSELGKIVLDNCSCAKEEDIDYTTLIYTTTDGYYVNTETCDTSDRLYKWLDDDVKGEFDENGNIITTRRHIDLDVDPDHVYETKFTIVNTEDGWRISKAEENPVMTNSEETDADAIAKELTDAYRDFMCCIFGGNLEVDKSDIITKTIKIDDDSELQRGYYRVIDTRYPTWADIEKRGYEIFDAEFGKEILGVCAWDEEDLNINTLVYSTDNGYYYEDEIIDYRKIAFTWNEDHPDAEFDENGNIITTMTIKIDDNPADYVYKIRFTIINTENGWRISKADEKIYGVSESDNFDPNINE